MATLCYFLDGLIIFILYVLGSLLIGKNGDFREETAEFERALAEVSRQGKANALRQHDDAFINDNSNDDELTKQIAGEFIFPFLIWR